MKIVTIEQMRELERRAEAAGHTTAMLMERAGYQVAQGVRAQLGGAAGHRVVILVGPGNNGGDALVAARHLADWGALLQLFLLADRPPEDANRQAVENRGLSIVGPASSDFLPTLKQALARADAVLDGILGTGRSRPLQGLFRKSLDLVQQAKAQRSALRLIALDIPTGLDADTGAVDHATFPANLTITLAAPKRGLFAFPGAAYVGALRVVDIGIAPEWATDIPLELITPELVGGLLPQRSLEGNKGAFGRVLIVAGSGNYMGAALLACRGAARIGAGLVTLAAPGSVILGVAGAMAETTYLALPEAGAAVIASNAIEIRPLLPNYDALLVGCGLGVHEETKSFVSELLLGDTHLPQNLVVDADGLNILAGISAWWSALQGQAVLTPHPGEMARLLHTEIAEVQHDRIGTALAAAQKWGCVVALKGAYTVVASPGGWARVSPFANPVLATAGTGDVLAGATAGLLAQGLAPFDAACAAVYLHGLAGQLYAEAHGNAGLLASDLAALLPDALKAVRAGSS